MQFALVNGIKTEAMPKGKGICPFCNSETIAKCGNCKIWHWAHKTKTQCDSWWERETEWHRQWKNYFPKDWQEVIYFDELTGEKHIADVKTSNNMVIEFQNSYIKQEEIVARENFYKRMFWIVNGNRNKFDVFYFRQSLKKLLRESPPNIFVSLAREKQINKQMGFHFMSSFHRFRS